MRPKFSVSPKNRTRLVRPGTSFIRYEKTNRRATILPSDSEDVYLPDKHPWSMVPLVAVTDPELAPAVRPPGGADPRQKQKCPKTKILRPRRPEGGARSTSSRVWSTMMTVLWRNFLTGKIEENKARGARGENAHTGALIIEWRVRRLPRSLTKTVDKQKKCPLAGRMEINADGVHKSRTRYARN